MTATVRNAMILISFAITLDSFFFVLRTTLFPPPVFAVAKEALPEAPLFEAPPDFLLFLPEVFFPPVFFAVEFLDTEALLFEAIPRPPNYLIKYAAMATTPIAKQ